MSYVERSLTPSAKRRPADHFLFGCQPHRLGSWFRNLYLPNLGTHSPEEQIAETFSSRVGQTEENAGRIPYADRSTQHKNIMAMQVVEN
jgi:hypothetical protein